ncbi:DUF938 domain-containing protein [Litorilituus sediminis]|uniref:DUF938 domain-containing protein n=1 Tax=Litorilituus sediminis TaxID=718192 RepID=A0A4V0ZFQ3_9GAMM|nr:DUF938 domain-containing protein [Litorilituus sediminis]QBG34600.1 DUF938 domain-containing protein [Litorilituus sediminis]
MNKPFSQACENNKRPILEILTKEFSTVNHVLEVGSGTGQHAVFFGQHLPHLTWQTSDLLVNHAGINAWLDEAALDNVQKPIVLDLDDSFPQLDKNRPIDALYTANTLHIVSWPLVVNFFKLIEKNLPANAVICIYGPFNYQGNFTSQSNADFDLWLKERNSESGIRDIESILKLATSSNLALVEDYSMPANNRLLTFTKVK